MLVQQSDSLEVEQEYSFHSDSVIKAKPAKPKTVWQVLNQLPANATPEQQDSAVQANFQPGKRIYNQRPDTIGITPGTRIRPDQRLGDVAHYRNPYLFTDTMSYSAPGHDRFGVAADPVPYTMSGDNIITGLLIGCFILAVISISNSRKFIARQAKNFFFTPKSERTTGITETSNEVRFQLFLVALTALNFSLIYFFYTLEAVADTFILSSQYQLLIIYFGVIIGYFLVRFLLYNFVNWVFFEPRANQQWNKSMLFIAAMEGLLLFPLVLLILYFGLPIKSAIIYTFIVIGIVELFVFYKCKIIFFRHFGGFLQNILYFCALEIAPLVMLLGTLMQLNDYLKINY